jgi:hypothetical protein
MTSCNCQAVMMVSRRINYIACQTTTEVAKKLAIFGSCFKSLIPVDYTAGVKP